MITNLEDIPTNEQEAECARYAGFQKICICEEVAKEQQRITVKVNRRRYGKEVTVVVEGLRAPVKSIFMNCQLILNQSLHAGVR